MENQVQVEDLPQVELEYTYETILGYNFKIGWDGNKMGRDHLNQLWFNKKQPKPNNRYLNEILDYYNENK